MKEITASDLKEYLTLLISQKHEDGEGGWREIWKKGPHLWASIWPLIGGDGFHQEDKGGPMASQRGYIKSLPPARYRIVVRAGIDLPSNTTFLWHFPHTARRLHLVSAPVLIQYNRFLCMTAVEGKDA